MRASFYIMAIIILIGTTSCAAQFGYTQYSITDGLKISTKTGTAKDEEGNKKPAILLRIENVNDYPVEFSYNIDLYYEGILRETGIIDGVCAKERQTMMGKLNGIYYIPEKFTEDQLSNSSFDLQINKIEVNKIEECEEDTIEEVTE